MKNTIVIPVSLMQYAERKADFNNVTFVKYWAKMLHLGAHVIKAHKIFAKKCRELGFEPENTYTGKPGHDESITAWYSWRVLENIIQQASEQKDDETQETRFYVTDEHYDSLRKMADAENTMISKIQIKLAYISAGFDIIYEEHIGRAKDPSTKRQVLDCLTVLHDIDIGAYGEDYDRIDAKRKKDALGIKPDDIVIGDRLSYSKAVGTYLEFMHTTDMRAYTFDAAMQRGLNAGTENDAKEMHKAYSNGVDPLYIIGVTNHTGMPDDEIESAYNMVLDAGSNPLFGRWINADGLEFTDISYPLNHGVDESEIIEIKRRYAQESVLRINSDGSILYV